MTGIGSESASRPAFPVYFNTRAKCEQVACYIRETMKLETWQVWSRCQTESMWEIAVMHLDQPTEVRVKAFCSGVRWAEMNAA